MICKKVVMSDVHVKVLIRGQADVKPQRVQVKTGAREIEAWDGDQQLVLTRHGTAEQNLRTKITELRQRPQLAGMSVPLARSIQDTLSLWVAWKHSMIDSMNQLFEIKSYLQLQQLSEQDDTALLHRKRELMEQLNSTLGAWRSQVKFLADERIQLLAVLNDRCLVEEQALRNLEAEDQSRSLYRVLRNAVRAMEQTLTEKRQLWTQRADYDHKTHIGILEGLYQGLDFCVKSFYKDAKALQDQAKTSMDELDRNIQLKQIQWTEACQQQYAQYVHGLQNPLVQLIKELDPKAPVNVLTRETLNNQNDPHCLRRCELALALLRQAQIGSTSTVLSMAPDADDILQHATRERTAAEQVQRQRYQERCLALQNEHGQRERSLQAARQRLRQLQAASEQIQQGLNNQFEHTQDGNQKQLAVASRLADHRLAQLRDEIKHTAETITLEQKQLEQLRLHVSAMDREAIVESVRDATQRVYHICRTMRARFEAATQAEDLLRHMIREQALSGIRDVHHIVLGLIQRMTQVVMAQFGTAQVELDRLQDTLNEAGRRVDTLNRGRMEQEERSDYIGLVRAVEEYADQITQRHAAQDAVNRAEMVQKTAEAAVRLIQMVQQAFI